MPWAVEDRMRPLNGVHGKEGWAEPGSSIPVPPAFPGTHAFQCHCSLHLPSLGHLGPYPWAQGSGQGSRALRLSSQPWCWFQCDQ